MHHLGLPSEIITLATAFPLGMTECPSSQALFYPFIPRRQRTDELMAIHYKYCAWMYVRPVVSMCSASWLVPQVRPDLAHRVRAAA
jgi:hypothetical protein